MNNKEQTISALESHYKSVMDASSLSINKYLSEGVDDQTLELLIVAIGKYESALGQFNFIQKIKQQIIEANATDES